MRECLINAFILLRRDPAHEFAADQRLERAHDARSQHDRVFRGLRIGAVAAHALHIDIDAVNIGQRIAGRIADDAGLQIGRVVKGDGVGRLGEAGIEPVLQHQPRAAPRRG